MKKVQKILVLAGVVEITAGISHFLIPVFLDWSPGYHKLTRIEGDFVILSVLAVGTLLIAFGIITILVVGNLKTAPLFAFQYTIVKSTLWFARIVLELVYPVKIHLFGLNEPFCFIIGPLIIEALLFIVSALLIHSQFINQLNLNEECHSKN